MTNGEGRVTEGPHELPAGWVWTTVGELAEGVNSGFASGQHNQEGVGVPHFRPMNISPTGEVDMSITKSVEATKYDRLLAGDVVFNNTNSPALLGKSTRISKDTNWAYSNHMTRIRLFRDTVEPGWLAHYLQHLYYQGYYRIHARNHVNQSSINKAQLASISLPLAPLPEQRRIVAKIEELLTSLDAGVVSLKRIHAALKRYRAAVLKAACEGRLVPQNPNDEPAEKLLERILAERRAKWEADLLAKGKDPMKAKYDQPKGPETEGLPELPEGWCWATVEQLNPPDRPCAYGVLQPGPDVEGGIPLVRVGDINNGFIDIAGIKRIDPQIAAQYPRTNLRGGEVLITLVGAIGRTGVAPTSLRGANTARAVGVIPLTEHVKPNWVEIWFRNPEKIAEMTSRAHEVARKTLNLEDVRAAIVGIPPSLQQQAIVTEVERRLSVVNELEKSVVATLVRADRLRQAILRRAFEGKLAA